MKTFTSKEINEGKKGWRRKRLVIYLRDEATPVATEGKVIEKHHFFYF